MLLLPALFPGLGRESGWRDFVYARRYDFGDFHHKDKAMTKILLVSLFGLALAPGAQSQEQAAGDSRRVHFTLPYKKALARSQAANRVLFLKPIYGGVDSEGAKDYRCGSW